MIEIYHKDFTPRIGDIGIVSSNHWISRVIKKTTHSIVNHAFLFVETLWGSNNINISEAEKEGITQTAWDSLKYQKGNNPNKQIYILRPIFDINVDAFSEFANSLDSKKYDFWGLALQFILQKTGRWLQKKKKGDKYLYCSEYVAYVYFKLYGLFPDWNKTSPKNIFRDYDKKKFVLLKIIKD